VDFFLISKIIYWINCSSNRFQTWSIASTMPSLTKILTPILLTKLSPTFKSQKLSICPCSTIWSITNSRTWDCCDKRFLFCSSNSDLLEATWFWTWATCSWTLGSRGLALRRLIPSTICCPSYSNSPSCWSIADIALLNSRSASSFHEGVTTALTVIERFIEIEFTWSRNYESIRLIIQIHDVRISYLKHFPTIFPTFPTLNS